MGHTAKGASWSLRRFGEAYLQEPDTLKKRVCRQVSKPGHRVGSRSRPRWSQGASPSGLITTTHGPGQLQALSAKYLRGSEPPTATALFILTMSQRGGGFLRSQMDKLRLRATSLPV